MTKRKYKRLPDIELDIKVPENSFQGKEILKRAGVNVPLNDDYIAEFKACRADIIYFIESYVKIVNLDSSELVYFDLRGYQVDMINDVMANRYHVTMLARQMGKTVTIAAILLYHIIFNKNYRVEVVGYTSAVAENILAIIKQMYENLPWWLQHGVKTWNVRTIELDSGNKVKAMSSNGTRGGSVNFLYIDEMAFIEDGEKFWGSVYPLTSSGKTTKIAITSTPKGMNYFHKIWSEAVQGVNGFKNFYAPYSANPDRDDVWAETTKASVGLKLWTIEYLCNFDGSSDTLVDGKFLSELPIKSAISEHIDSKSSTRIYSHPFKGNEYVICSDIAEGVGKDFSTIIVIDVTTEPYQIVFVYKSNYISAHNVAFRLYDIGMKYNMGALVIENNNFGAETCNLLYNEIGYENMVTSVIGDSDKTIGIHRAGIRMTSRVKAAGCTKLKTMVERGIISLNDVDIINEFKTFESKGKSYEAITGKNDDLVMALVNFAYATKLPSIMGLLPESLGSSIIKSASEDSYEDSYTQVVAYDDGFSHLLNYG